MSKLRSWRSCDSPKPPGSPTPEQITSYLPTLDYAHGSMRVEIWEVRTRLLFWCETVQRLRPGLAARQRYILYVGPYPLDRDIEIEGSKGRWHRIYRWHSAVVYFPHRDNAESVTLLNASSSSSSVVEFSSSGRFISSIAVGAGQTKGNRILVYDSATHQTENFDLPFLPSSASPQSPRARIVATRFDEENHALLFVSEFGQLYKKTLFDSSEPKFLRSFPPVRPITLLDSRGQAALVTVLVFVMRNRGKLVELRALLPGVDVRSLTSSTRSAAISPRRSRIDRRSRATRSEKAREVWPRPACPRSPTTAGSRSTRSAARPACSARATPAPATTTRRTTPS